MIIAVNTRILSGNNAAAQILIKQFENIAADNKAHQVYFISNEELPALPAGNIKCIVIKQKSSIALLWKIWYNYKLPAILKKIKADVLVSADGICSLKTKLPQYVVVNELEIFHHPEWYSKQYVSFIKANLPLCLKKTAGIITWSSTVKNEIINRFVVEGSKISIASFRKNSKWQPSSWHEKQAVKAACTAGNEYFLFYGAIHHRSNLTNLLKAFSLFKKRQKSAMQLVILTDEIPEKHSFVESLRLYKYRNEVKLLNGLSETEIISLTAAACCAINLSPLYSDINFLQNAVLCEVPVIAANNGQSVELLKDAALYANPTSIDSVAAQMMLIYKDENKQNELVQNGKQLYNLTITDDGWQMIVSTANAG